jgi:hypothetical protein
MLANGVLCFVLLVEIAYLLLRVDGLAMRGLQRSPLKLAADEKSLGAPVERPKVSCLHLLSSRLSIKEWILGKDVLFSIASLMSYEACQDI